jgi:hypothetical protein
VGEDAVLCEWCDNGVCHDTHEVEPLFDDPYEVACNGTCKICRGSGMISPEHAADARAMIASKTGQTYSRCPRCLGDGCEYCKDSGIADREYHPIERHLFEVHKALDDLHQMSMMNDIELDFTHKDWHEQEEEDGPNDHPYEKIAQAQQAADVDEEREPQEAKPSDLAVHMLTSHPEAAAELKLISDFEDYTDPELQELHMDCHIEGQNDHNPEVLRTASFTTTNDESVAKKEKE